MAASRSAATCPIPEVAPVITITFPCMVQWVGITDGPRSEWAATVPRFGPHGRCRASGSPSGKLGGGLRPPSEPPPQESVAPAEPALEAERQPAAVFLAAMS